MNRPEHLAVIMDGNRRWAKEKGLESNQGHRAGMDALERLVKLCPKYGIKYLTVYALSTENLTSRKKVELKALFALIKEGFLTKVPILKKEGVRIKFLGDISGLPWGVRKVIERTEKELQAGENLVLAIAINYSARSEIEQAGLKLSKESGKFADFLYTFGLPDPDLMIRTGGEKRLSNFLLWQLAYTELYFTDCFWPDFDETELQKALQDFEERKRNFGA